MRSVKNALARICGWNDPTGTLPRKVFAQDFESNRHFPDNTISNTKYTWISFVPLNLMEQFSRHINRYFLLIACLQLISELTPVNPLSTFGPLVLIFAISAIKELVDDRARAAQDKVANSRKYIVLRNGKEELIASRDIRVGDIVKLMEDEEVPCDLCLLSSSSKNGICYVQTTNLDGETNLKARQAPMEIQNLGDISEFIGFVECAPPDASVYKFDARLFMTPDGDKEPISISGNQFLQQTISIRNTEFIYGIAVYTGNQTKFSKNKDRPPLKWTQADMLTNNLAVILFIFQLGLVILLGVIGIVWKNRIGRNRPYLGYEASEPWYQFLIIPGRFLLLLSTIIPISLKVTLDLCKMFYAKFIEWDKELHEPGEQPATANNSAISEDLGQIQYVLSDKTGTLTQNTMVFRKLTVDGTIYDVNLGEENDAKTLENQNQPLHSALNDENSNVVSLVLNMALNHAVVPTKKDDGIIVYKAASPDEEALVSACSKLGFKLISRDGDVLTLEIQGMEKKYQLLQELEFTSNRKRSSSVIKDLQTNSLFLYIKGADDVIYERLAKDVDTSTVKKHLDAFAQEGLRTLVYGMRNIDQSEFESWLQIFKKAKTEITNREQAVEDACEKLEHDFLLTGASAIEDKLQVDVAPTIASLREAGIRFWMLTGDKFNTALQIATSCAMKLPEGPTSVLFEISGSSVPEVGNVLDSHLARLHELDQAKIDTCVIVRGETLPEALHDDNKAKFLELTLAAKSVICCRFAPRQKAQIVNMVRSAGKITLAIGDGGNDVVMIQAAHIGVGIRGKEGLQAARAADYQINYFRYLKRLLLVHGRQSYLRTSFVSQYSYYKSLLFCMFQILYAIYSGFSGLSLFNSANITAYNMLLFFPIVTSIFDQDLPPKVLMDHPRAYRDCANSSYFSYKTYAFWFLRGIIQGILIFFVTLGVFGLTSYHHRADGSPMDWEVLGVVFFFAYLWSQSITIMLELQYLTVWNFCIIWGFHFFSFILMFSTNLTMNFNSLNPLYATSRALSDPLLWLSNILTTVLAVGPVILFNAVKSIYYPSYAQKIRSSLLLSKANEKS